MWPFGLRRRTRLWVEDVEFRQPQDGPAERDLTDALRPLLAGTASVRAAFLVRARYARRSEEEVVLALDAGGRQEPKLVAAVSSVFRALFNSSCHLDILFLATPQVLAVREVRPPFYERDVAT